MEAPRHSHGCPNCIYLGTYLSPSGENTYDMYYCKDHVGSEKHPDVIVRWGEDSSQVKHLNLDAELDHAAPAMVVAYNLAKLPNTHRPQSFDWETKITNIELEAIKYL